MRDPQLSIVAVAGAAGFVGRPLVERLAERFRVIALSRRAREDDGRVVWRQADLMSHPAADGFGSGIDPAPVATLGQHAPAAGGRASDRQPFPYDGEASPETSRIVRSVQRLPLPAGGDVAQIAGEYFRQLSRWGGRLLRVNGNDQSGWTIRLGQTGPTLMRFVPDHARSSPDRIVFDLVGGYLIDTRRIGRFEFRKVLGGDALLCSVHGYAPRLWWPFYVVTQAPLHLLVMKAFGRHLQKHPSSALAGPTR